MQSILDILFYCGIIWMAIYLFRFINQQFPILTQTWTCSSIITTYVIAVSAMSLFFIRKYSCNFTEWPGLAIAIIEHTGQLSAATLILVAIGFGLYAFLCKQGTDYSALLMRLLIASFAASTFPTGISLILCAFVGALEKMTGPEVYLAYAGLSLVFMTFLILFEEKKRIGDYHKAADFLNKPNPNNQSGEISST